MINICLTIYFMYEKYTEPATLYFRPQVFLVRLLWKEVDYLEDESMFLEEQHSWCMVASTEWTMKIAGRQDCVV